MRFPAMIYSRSCSIPTSWMAALLSALPGLSGGAALGQAHFDLAAVGTENGVVTRVFGSTGNGERGVPVAGGLDCDGDGFADYAMASIQANPKGRSGAGEIMLIFGDGTIGGTIDTAGFKKRILKIAGDQDLEVAGNEIWMDDVTGDGLGDLLICRQNYTPQAGREGAGALTIIAGSPLLRSQAKTLDYLDLRDPPGNLTIITLSGAEAYDRFGIWVRTGDVSGDGIADIAVGADEAESGGADNAGMVYVIRGGAHLGVTRKIDLSEFGSTALAGHLARIRPPAGSEGFHLGATCQIADLDGNGRGEVLAAAALARAGAAIRLQGAPPGTGESFGGSKNGTVFIAWDDNFPEGLWSAGYAFDLSAPVRGETSRIDGSESNRVFGEEIVGGSDFNGDGEADLFIGDLTADGGNGIHSGAGYILFSAATVKGLQYGLDNPPEGLSQTLLAGPLAGSIGTDTVIEGDFNADGIADLAIGNPKDDPLERIAAGTMHILYGQARDWPPFIDLARSALPVPGDLRIIRIEGARGRVGSDSGDILCYSAAVGDVNGDGVSDIIVNEMEGNGIGPEAVDVGNLLIISGNALPVPMLSALSFSTAFLEFPTTEAEIGPVATHTVTLKNIGTEPVGGIIPLLEGPDAGAFIITADSGESNLAPGEERRISLTFDPVSSGLKEAVLNQANGLGAEAEGIQLRGIGIRSPRAEDDERETPLDSPVRISVLSNDEDPDGDRLQLSLSLLPAHGKVVLNDDGSLTYTPEPGFIGDDFFFYAIADGTGGRDEATVRVKTDYFLVPGGKARLVNEKTPFLGNTYNGFELVGGTGVFSSAVGEITRISFLDPEGDLVFAEFGSNDPATTLRIDLENLKEEVASPYDQPATRYSMGLAGFRIENPTKATFFSVFTTGNDPARVDPALLKENTFAGAVDGFAQVRAVEIIVPEGETLQFGGLNAANANFMASSGMIGISARGVRFNRYLHLGDITPLGTARPKIILDPASVLEEIFINGGDLGEATGEFQIETNGIVYPFPFTATSGQRSIRNSPLRTDLGDGFLKPVEGTFVERTDDYFATDGQSAGVKQNPDHPVREAALIERRP